MPMPHDADVVWENGNWRTWAKRANNHDDSPVEMGFQGRALDGTDKWVDTEPIMSVEGRMLWEHDELEAIGEWVRTRYAQPDD